MRKYLFFAAALLLPAALCWNLGLMVFIDDEAIRTLVAYEMAQTGNWLVPSLHADAYLNKPPLFNWILAVSFWAHGQTSEWAARIPTVISLLGFAATAYWFSRRHFSRYLAGVHALTVITCGRMLFWDSMLALIDVTFSWVVYAQIMLLYHHGSRGRWWTAFGWSYALTAAGFMLKGLPAIAFQGLTVLAILSWTSSWRRFFSPAHLLSGLGCLALLALYYLPYSAVVPLDVVFERLFVESGKRTAVAQGFWASVKHVFAFPLEMIYHFLPWTLLLVHAARRGVWRRLKTNDYAAFLALAFAVNIPVYWLSPNVYPRYVLMLFPLLFGALLPLHEADRRAGDLRFNILRYLLLGIMGLVALAFPFVGFVPELSFIGYRWVLGVFLGAAAGAMVYLGQRGRAKNLLVCLALVLLVIRIGFNGLLLPARAAGNERGNQVRATAYRAMAASAEAPVAIYGHSLIEPATGYYLTQARGNVIPRRFFNFDTTTVYVLSNLQYPDVANQPVDSIYLRHRHDVRNGKRWAHYPVTRLLPPLPDTATLRLEYMDGMGSGLSPTK